jgi:hypothetical protein
VTLAQLAQGEGARFTAPAIPKDRNVLAEVLAQFLLLRLMIGVSLGHGLQQVKKVSLAGLDTEAAAVVVREAELVEPWGPNASIG